MKLKIIGIVSVIITVFLSNNVYAFPAYNGTFYEGEKIDGIYFYKHLKNSNDGVSSEASVYRKSIDNKIVYSIEPLVLKNEKDGDLYEITSNQSPKYLSSSASKKIEALAYYGYGYKDSKYNHSDLKWYAVTQYLIWQTAGGDIECYFTDSLTSTEEIYPFLDEIAELEKLVYEHTTDIVFLESGDTIKSQVDAEVRLKDKNGVLNNFQDISSDTLSFRKVNSSEIIIVAKDVGRHSLKLTQWYTYYSKFLTYYQSKNAQDMIEPGNLNIRRNTFFLEVKEEADESEEDNEEDVDLKEETDESEEDNEEDVDLEEETDESEEDKEEVDLKDEIEESEENNNEDEDLKEETDESEEDNEEDVDLKDETEEFEENSDIGVDEPNDLQDDIEDLVEIEIEVSKDEDNLPEDVDKDLDNTDTNETSGNIKTDNVILAESDSSFLDGDKLESIMATVPPTEAHSFSFIFYLISSLCLLLIKYAK